MNAHRSIGRIVTIVVSICAALPLIGRTHTSTAVRDRQLPALSVEVTQTQTQITIAGARPNQRVLLIGYSRWHHDYVQRLRRERAWLIADASGIASLTPDGGVRPDSVWVAVDVQTGRYGSASPLSSPMREFAIEKSALSRDKLVPGQHAAYFVMVRPGEGAWEIDANGEISPGRLKTIGRGPAAPENFRAGDLLLVFSPERGTFSSIRLEP